MNGACNRDNSWIARNARDARRKRDQMIDERAIEEHIRGILIALGDDPDREGIKDTPKRVARMYSEVFEGMNYTNHEIAEMFGKTFEEGFDEEMASDPGRVVVMKDIDMFSYCEHHMALMHDMKATVAYVPGGKVIGLSKIARVCDMVGRWAAAAGEDRKRHRGYHLRDHWQRRCCGHSGSLPQLRHSPRHQEDEHQDLHSGAARTLQDGSDAAVLPQIKRSASGRSVYRSTTQC